MNTNQKPEKVKLPESYRPHIPAVLAIADEVLSRQVILPVRRVVMLGQTGDNRSPESFSFPACMTSLMESLGQSRGDMTIYAHNRNYTKRLDNSDFLSASGMAFSLLWDEGFDIQTMDVGLLQGQEKVVERGFLWAGYSYTIFRQGDDINEVKTSLMAAIKYGKPVLGFNLFGEPEFSIICGYTRLSEVLFGWSHSQKILHMDTAENGMFRLEQWEDHYEFLVIPEESVERADRNDVLTYGLKIMEERSCGKYAAGFAAFDKWGSEIEHPKSGDKQYLVSLFRYHLVILFNLAECRAWGSDFLRDSGMEEAADIWIELHDLCWKAKAAAANGFARKENRQAVGAVLREIREKDETVYRMIQKYIKC